MGCFKMFRNLSLKKKLYVSFIMVLLLPTIIIGTLSYVTMKNKIEEKMLDSAKQNADILNSIITDTINTKVNDVNYLSGYFNQLNTSKETNDEALNLLGNYQNEHSELLASYVGTETGAMLLKPDQELPDGYDPRKRGWYQDAMKKKGNAVVTTPYIDAFTGKVIVTVAKALNDGSGVVGFDLNLDNLAKTVKKVKFGKEGYLAILDQNKKVIVHPIKKPGSLFKESFIEKVYAKNSGAFGYQFNGSQKTMYFNTNELTGWKVVGTLVNSEMKAETLPLLYKTLIVLAFTLVMGTIIATLIIRSITVRLGLLVDASNSISEGNLKIESISVENNDELGQLSTSFNKMKESLHTVILEVNEKSESLAAASEQLSSSAEQSGKASEQVVAAIQELASGAESQNTNLLASAQSLTTMTTSIQQMSEKASLISDVTSEASRLAENGGITVGKTLNQMNSISSSVTKTDQMIQSLSQKSEEIVKILDVITGIASQTNLLALNAAIEAARAGEHGKGFAVVAEEVRKLAEDSSHSASQITNILKEIQQDTNNSVSNIEYVKQEVDEGVKVATETQDRFDEILMALKKIVVEIHEISSVSRFIEDGAQHLNISMDEVRQIAEETNLGTQQIASSSQEQLASSEEITASSLSLSNMADDLRNLISNFKI
jgi:methyl-accepting chemotaxis protein